MLRKDPCGFTCLLMTYGAVGYADYVVVRWILLETMAGSNWCAINMTAFNLLVALLLMSHSRAVFSDPGVVPLPKHPIDFSSALEDNSGKCVGLPPPDENWTICNRCEMYRPPRSYHCRICQRCIQRMDHHCPWINNCVGEKNQKYFLQFLFYVGLLALYSVTLVIISWNISNPVKSDTRQNSFNASASIRASREAMLIKQARILHSVILVLESILFGLFAFAIGCDQFDAIFSDATLVEQAKRQGVYRPKKPKMALLAEVCGRSKHPITWFLPCQGTTAKRVEPSIDYTV